METFIIGYMIMNEVAIIGCGGRLYEILYWIYLAA